jgi:hypothetical protein
MAHGASHEAETDETDSGLRHEEASKDEELKIVAELRGEAKW